MTPTKDPPRAYSSDEDLRRMLSLVDASDSVELKLTVPEAERSATLGALGIDPLDAHIRQVFFFDTPDLALDSAGVVLRARRIQGEEEGDTVLKLRPVVPAELAPDLRRMKRFGIEVDGMPGGYVCSASLKGRADSELIKRTAAGEGALRKLFSKKQRALFADRAPQGVELDALSVLGPIHVLKLKYSPPGLGQKVTIELWHYPDGGRILELSTKCSTSEPLAVAAKMRAYLEERGVSLSGEQQTKTRTALEYFSRTLAPAPASD